MATHGWGASNSRSRSDSRSESEREHRARARARARARPCPFPLLVLLTCTREADDPRPKIAGEPIDDRVIDMVAKRDGLSRAAARAHVVETLRWSADAAAARPPDAPELDPSRRDHLRRTALARLWLAEVFEPTHLPADIPADDPLIARARSDSRHVHPEIVEVCHAIFVPEGIDDPAAAEIAAADPRWRAKALPFALSFAKHIAQTVPYGDPDACTFFANNGAFEPKAQDGVALRNDGRGGFVLDACAETNDDGSCRTPRFAPEWVEVIRTGPVPGLRGPFFTRFGVHVALVTRVLPATPTDEAEALEHVRAAVHDAWRTREVGTTLQSLRVEKAAQVIGPDDGGEATP